MEIDPKKFLLCRNIKVSNGQEATIAIQIRYCPVNGSVERRDHGERVGKSYQRGSPLRRSELTSVALDNGNIRPALLSHFETRLLAETLAEVYNVDLLEFREVNIRGHQLHVRLQKMGKRAKAGN